jgi:uncharacterized protein (TIGR03437 family)
MKFKIKRIQEHEPGRASFRSPSSRGIASVLLAASLLTAFALLTWPGASVRASLVETAADNIINTAAGGAFQTTAPAKQTPLAYPVGVARDTQGRGFFFIDDYNSSRLLRFTNTTQNPVTIAGITIPSGQVGLIAGGGSQDAVDGANPRDVYLGGMNGIVVHSSGNIVFFQLPILNSANVMAINLTAQAINFGDRTLQPGKLSSITFASIPDARSLQLGPDGKFYLIGNTSTPSPGGKVFKINFGGDFEIVAGGGNPPVGENGDGGPATQARITNPTGIVFDLDGNLLIAEGGSSQRLGAVRKVATDGFISTMGDTFSFLTGFPVGIAINPTGIIYVALGNGQRIVRITSGSPTPIAGNGSGFSCDTTSNPTCGDGGPALQAVLNLPGSSSEIAFQSIQMSADANGLYIPDGQRGQESGYAHIRYINRGASQVSIAGTTIAPLGINAVAGSGRPQPYDGALAQYATLNGPHGVAVDANGNLFIADTFNHFLRFVNRGTSAVTLFPGTPSAVTVQPGAIATLNRDVGTAPVDERILTAFFDSLQGLHAMPNGILIADGRNGTLWPPGNFQNRKSGLVRFLNTSASTVTFYPGSASPIQIPPGHVKTIGGRPPGQLPAPVDIGDGGPATSAVIFTADVAADAAGNIYVADFDASKIRKINANTGVVTSILSDLNKPSGIAFDGSGRLLVADTYNNRVMRENSAGSGTFTAIGDGTLTPPIQRPRDIVADSGGRIYITSSGSNRVVQLVAPNNALGTTSFFAGSGAPGYLGDGGPALDGQLNFPNPASNVTDQPTIGITLLKNEAGIVFADPNNDRVREVSLTAPVGTAASVSAASFKPGGAVAPDSIVAVFGANFATGVAVGGTIPLPTSLLGTTIKVRDSGGTERLAGLFFVSPGQCNYVIPTGTSLGPATVTVTSGDGRVSVGTVQIALIGPGLFTADSSGTGLVAAYILRIRGQQQIIEQMAVYNPATQKFDPIPVDLDPPTDLVFLVLYGTGIRNRTGDAGVVIKIGGTTMTTLYSSVASGYVGLDQINPSQLPQSLKGRQLVDVEVTVDGVATNVGKVYIK